MGTLSFYKKVFDFFLKRFQTTKGRQPMNPAEYYGIEREAVNWVNKTKGQRLPGQAKPDWHTGWTPRVIEGGKGKEGIEKIDIGEVIPKETPLTKDKSFRIKQGLSTQIKLNTLPQNKQLAKEFVTRKNAEFNSLDRKGQTEILERLEISIKNEQSSFATPVKPEDFASGGIARVGFAGGLLVNLYRGAKGLQHGAIERKLRKKYIETGMDKFKAYDKAMNDASDVVNQKKLEIVENKMKEINVNSNDYVDLIDEHIRLTDRETYKDIKRWKNTRPDLADKTRALHFPHWAKARYGENYQGVLDKRQASALKEQSDEINKMYPDTDGGIQDLQQRMVDEIDDMNKANLDEIIKGRKKNATGGIARVGMFGGGPIVKGGRWFLKSLRDTRKQMKTMRLSPGQLKYYLDQIDDQIKNIEAGGKIPDEVIQTIRKDPKFKSVSQTRANDPDLREMEEVLLEYGEKHASGGIAGQLHLNRPGYQRGERVNPFEETGNLPGGAYDTREYIQSPILKEDTGITTVEAPPKEDKRTFEGIMSKHLGGIKAKRPKHFYFEKDEFGNVKLDEFGKSIKRKFRFGPEARFGIADKAKENLAKVMKAVELAELNKEQSNHFWNKFGLEFGIKGEELEALKAGKRYFKKENLPLINLNEDTLLNITKGLDLPKNTRATLFAESNLGGDINSSLELANKNFKTTLTKDDVSWDIKPTFNVGEIEIAPSVKGVDDVIEKIKLALDNPNWTLEGELIKAQKRKETGGAPDQETQKLQAMLMADPRLWKLFGGSRGMMQMFGDTMTEDQKGDIFKLSGSYTFDNDFKISPSLEQDLLTHDTTYGLGLTKDGFSADLGYDEGLTGSVAYGPVQIGSTGDGARLDLNKNIWTGYSDPEETNPYGSLDIKGYYDTRGNWNIGPIFSMSFGGPKNYEMVEGITEHGQKGQIPKTWIAEGKSIAELQEALQKEKLYAKGGLAKVLGV